MHREVGRAIVICSIVGKLSREYLKPRRPNVDREGASRVDVKLRREEHIENNLV